MKRFISVILSLCLMAGIIIPSNISNAASYGDKLKYLNNKITLGTKQTFSGTGKLKHGAKSYGGFLTKAKNIKIDYTVESSEPVENGDNYSVTFNVSYKFKDNPKFTKKTVKGYGYGTIEPIVLYSVFDYNTGYNLEVENDKNVVVTQNGKATIKYYKKQNLRHKVKPYKDWYRNKKSASSSFTVTYPKSFGDVCVGIGFINNHGSDWSSYEDGLGKEDGWDSGYYTDYDEDDNEIKKPWKWGNTAYYKRGEKTVSYVRLPSSESASETSCLKSASVASSSASSSKPDGCTNEESIDIGKTITSSVSSGDNWLEPQEGDKWYSLTIPADTAYEYVDFHTKGDLSVKAEIRWPDVSDGSFDYSNSHSSSYLNFYNDFWRTAYFDILSSADNYGFMKGKTYYIRVSGNGKYTIKTKLIKKKKFVGFADNPNKLGETKANYKILHFLNDATDHHDSMDLDKPSYTKITLITKKDIINEDKYYADGQKREPSVISHGSGDDSAKEYRYTSYGFDREYGFYLKRKPKKGEKFKFIIKKDGYKTLKFTAKADKKGRVYYAFK